MDWDAVDFAQASKFCGQRAGFVFHVRDGKLGYPRDTASITNSRCSVLLAELVGPPEESRAQGRSTSRQNRRARRRRGTDGNRIRPLSRRWSAGTCTPTPYIPAGANVSQDRWWTQHGLWAVDTVNANSWPTYI